MSACPRTRSQPWTSTPRQRAWHRGPRRSSTRSGCSATVRSKTGTLRPGTNGKDAETPRRGIRPHPTDFIMLRGEIRLIDLDAARATEANNRRRPGFVGNDPANASATRRGVRMITLVPVTNNMAHMGAFQTRNLSARHIPGSCRCALTAGSSRCPISDWRGVGRRRRPAGADRVGRWP